ncbi:hypothetical protein FOA52_006609 [Chlamydomonas sp. UWO 241]|nr:hypothetical protein FOA52_006609 [Chlamydomonas sp. UWO 241]
MPPISSQELLRASFESTVGVQNGEMDDKTFLQCCKDSRLLFRKPTGRVTCYDIEEVFKKKKEPLDAVEARINAAAPATLSTGGVVRKFASIQVRDTPAPAPGALVDKDPAGEKDAASAPLVRRCSLMKPRVVVAKGDDAPLPPPSPGRRSQLPRLASCDALSPSPVLSASPVFSAAGPRTSFENAARASCERAAERRGVRLSALSDMGHTVAKDCERECDSSSSSSCEPGAEPRGAFDAAADAAALGAAAAVPKLHRRLSLRKKRASGEGKGAGKGAGVSPRLTPTTMPSSAGAGAMLMASMMAVDTPSMHRHARSSMPGPSMSSLLSSLGLAGGDAPGAHSSLPSARTSLPSVLRGSGNAALAAHDRYGSLHSEAGALF